GQACFRGEIFHNIIPIRIQFTASKSHKGNYWLKNELPPSSILHLTTYQKNRGHTEHMGIVNSYSSLDTNS
ncbi:MAG: hypothetical protein WB988_12790, partial [Candidatus Nitrosopolaris sp.]